MRENQSWTDEVMAIWSQLGKTGVDLKFEM